MRRTLIPMMILAAGCASTQPAAPPPAPAPSAAATPAPAPAPTPAPAAASAADLVDHEGDSADTAVAVPADATHEGADFENQWIFKRFGRFRRQSWGVAHAGDRRFDVINIELPDGSTHRVFFDITEMWNAWKPKQ